MTWQSICADILLVIGVAVMLLCCLGVLVMRETYDRIHFVGPATALGMPLIAAAVVLQEALSTAGIKALLIAGVMLLAGPVLAHATARAARVRRLGAWQPRADERLEVV